MRKKTLVAATAVALLTMPSLDRLFEGDFGPLAESPAYGQEEDPEVTAEAKKHYKMGQDAYAEGKYEVAIKELKKAYLLKRIPAILVNIAMTYRKTKDFDMSLYFYKKYLTEAPADDKQRPSVDTAIVETEKERELANRPQQLEPAKPAVEMAKAEPVKPAVEAAKPVAEAGKTVAEAAKPVAEAAKPAAEAAKPVVEAGTAVAEAGQAKVEGAAAQGVAATPAPAAEAVEVAKVEKSATDWAHTPVDSAPPGQPIDVRVQMPVMKGVKVKVYFRKEGQATFESAELKRRGNEKVARLPATVTSGRTFQYYVEARDAAGTVVKNSGSESSPNIVLIDATARPQLAGAEVQGDSSEDEDVAKRVVAAPKRDIENEAVNFDLTKQGQAMAKLRAQMRSGKADSAKKSLLNPVGWAGVGLMSLGAVALGAGGGMFGVAAGRADAVSSDSLCQTKVKVGGVAQCPHFGGNTEPMLNRALKPATADYERQGKTFDTVGIALASAGGAVLATGTTLLIYDVIKKRQAARPPAPKTRKVKKVIEVEEPATSMLLTPVVSPQGVGLVGEFHF